MTPSLLSMAKELVMANIQAGHVAPEAVSELLQSTYVTLERLQTAEEQEAPIVGTSARAPVMKDWKASISPHAVTCMECGATFKQLSTRHLRMHGFDGRTYREKYGIPRAQSLSARDVLARRREIVQRIRPWEKSPTSQAEPEGKASAKRKGAAKTARRGRPKGS